MAATVILKSGRQWLITDNEVVDMLVDDPPTITREEGNEVQQVFRLTWDGDEPVEFRVVADRLSAAYDYLEERAEPQRVRIRLRV